MAALGYADGELVAIETFAECLGEMVRDWTRRGMEVHLTTVEDAVQTWRAAHCQ